MKLVIALGLAALAGCTAAYPAASPGITPGQARLGSEPFRIGPVQVLIRPQPEVEFYCRLQTGASSGTTTDWGGRAPTPGHCRGPGSHELSAFSHP